VSSKHPNNGPTFSKPTIRKARPALPSPDKQEAARKQSERDAAFLRRLHKDPSVILELKSKK
jgi:hypothetical protein